MTGNRTNTSNVLQTGEDADSVSALQQAQDRDRQIVRTSIVGIVANVLLAVFKAIVGLVSGSIAITLDAVNNLSDAASSVITIIGTKLAAKPADKKHPFGYGRIEYLSAMIISLIVLYAGVTSLRESVNKIIHPEAAEYTAVSLIIVVAGVAVKILLGRYVERVGHKVNSDSLVNSGKDATLDSVISASTLVAAVIYMASGVSLESWLGAVISLVIIKSGIEMLVETLSEILGEGAGWKIAGEIKATVLKFPGVSGVYDVVLNNYGPDNYNGSLHIEVPDTYTANQIDELTRQITAEIYTKYQIVLTAISIYSMNTTNPDIIRIRENIRSIVRSEPNVRQMHGFYLQEDMKEIRFDLVVSFDADDRLETFRKAVLKVQEAYPGYHVTAVMDTDYTEGG